MHAYALYLCEMKLKKTSRCSGYYPLRKARSAKFVDDLPNTVIFGNLRHLVAGRCRGYRDREVIVPDLWCLILETYDISDLSQGLY